MLGDEDLPFLAADLVLHDLTVVVAEDQAAEVTRSGRVVC
jgi:hypothetical protein